MTLRSRPDSGAASSPTGGRDRRRTRSRWRLRAAVFLAALAVLLASPAHLFSDSKYSLLVTQSLLERRGLAIEAFLPPSVRDAVCDPARGAPYQLTCVEGRLYHYFPTGGALLAVPFAVAGRPFGLSPVDGNGRWTRDGELRLQRYVAAVLMALFAVATFELGATQLPARPALGLTLAAVLGTQVWSTASRVLWPQTWTLLLGALAVLELLRAERDDREPRPALLATLLAWAFFTRPTAALALAAVGVYLLRRRRRLWMTFAAVGVAWLAPFVAWSSSVFGTAVPPYYALQRLSGEHFAEALAGNLISPARGLLTFLPHVLFLGYLVVRYPPRDRRALAVLAGAVASAHLVVTSAYPHWWGGHSFGPRLLTDMLPWLALLAAVSVRSWLASASSGRSTREHRRFRLERAVAALLVAMAIAIHAGGALSEESELWNWSPQRIDSAPQRVWDWSDPQLVAFATDRPRVRMDD
jgi:hypothetical protein